MTSTDTQARGFTIVRRYDAPRELVFRSWTDPALLQWFAGIPADPAHPTTVDLRPGGDWRIHLVEDEGRGRAYVTGGRYREIAEPERLVFSFGAVGGWPELTAETLDDLPVVTIELSEAPDGGTEMVATIGFSPAMTDERVAQWLAMGIQPGFTATIDRLAPALEARTS